MTRLFTAAAAAALLVAGTISANAGGYSAWAGGDSGASGSVKVYHGYGSVKTYSNNYTAKGHGVFGIINYSSKHKRYKGATYKDKHLSGAVGHGYVWGNSGSSGITVGISGYGKAHGGASSYSESGFRKGCRRCR